MADVLGAVEDFESEAVEELPLSEEAANGLETPAGPGYEELGDIFELGDL